VLSAGYLKFSSQAGHYITIHFVCFLKAQADAEILKSVVMPLEEEVKILKSKLRETDSKLQELLAQVYNI